MPKKIVVLLSTYNGEKYLRKQLDSLLSQEGVDVTIRARDDGSTDKTKQIIEEYAKNYSNIEYYYGKNLGYAKSFWDLLSNASDYDYYAFCDQDDIWLPKKLIKAIELIEKSNENKENMPILYTSNVISVNNNLEIISNQEFSCDHVINVYESFQKSVLPGCTFVFNHEAKNILKKYQGHMESHDWACYCIISVFGKVLYDTSSYIHYRIHQNNVIGHETRWKVFKIQVKRFFKKSTHTRSLFAQDFLKYYENDINESLKNDLSLLAYYRKNIKKKISLFCSRKFRGFIFKIYVLLNRV